ncbi:hypothetical protein F7R91_41665 [Streptomyces luteolifulvus]|uniref:Nitroreductase n=1 Tax=Streptomyces luteolifulvus TaxID=2615112 RepID=A0A643JTX2_9ACTN|nr:hypothetical protein [Streptomyces luteolifulvus]KAB1138862.1 hypothetical protein F7R91_41665 [Streptomyces luteolifulvus]
MSAEPLTAQAAAQLIRDAVAAPSMHNAQPWRFRFFTSTRTLHLRSDPNRAMPHADPDGRGLHLGCGAALFNLRVAATQAGWEPVTATLPNPADPQLLATVRPVRPSQVGRDDLAALYPAIQRRHTSRCPFTEEEIPEAIRAGLCGAALMEGARLVFPEAWHLQTLLDLIDDAEGRNAPTPRSPGFPRTWSAGRTSTTASRPPKGSAYAFGPRKRDGRAPGTRLRG